MARDHRRAELEVHDVLGMLRQAAISFKASIPLFLTLALLSSIYETAVERSALLSGISVSGQNSNFSFQFSFDPQQPAQTHHNDVNTGGLRKPDTGDSLLSRLFTAFLPDDYAFQPEGVKQEELRTSALMGSDVEDAAELKHGEPSSPPMGSDVGDAAQLQGLQPEELNHGELSPDTETPSALKSLQAVVVHKDGDSSNDGSGLTGGRPDNGRQLDQNGISGGNVDSDTVEKSHALESLQVPVHKDGDSGKDGGGLAGLSDNGMQLDQNGVLGENADSDTIEFEDKNWIPSGKEADEEYLFEDMLEKNEDTDANSGLLHLKIETVSNETKKSVQENVIDAIDLTFFTGKLLGGRGLDQGAMPHGGMTMLLMFLVVAVAVTIFLAVVGFQHAVVLGSVAYSVVTTHMGKRANARQAIRSSLKSGVKRLMWLAILHATLRGLQSLFFMKTLFGGVMEMEQVEQLVLRLSATPFAFLAPFMDVDATNLGMAIRISLFIGFDYIFDGIAYCIYVVACWVTIMERNHRGLGAISRSCNLVKSMEVQALVVRLLEAMVCGRTSRWLLQQAIGHFAAAFIICTAQVYFLVLWLIFYMSARWIHDPPSHFSYRTLEDFLDRFK